MDAKKKQRIVAKIGRLLAKEKVLEGLGPREQAMLVDRAKELALNNIIGQEAFDDIVSFAKKLQRQKKHGLKSGH